MLIAILMMVAGCPAGPQSDENLRREVEGLKKEVEALKNQVKKLEAGQQLPSPARLQPDSPPATPAPWEVSPRATQVISVSQLIREKDRYMGARVTVKGEVGPVLVHHKSLMLKAPEGMVEVLLSKAPDQQMVEKILSMTIDVPLTVTGMVRQSSRDSTPLQIAAEELAF